MWGAGLGVLCVRVCRGWRVDGGEWRVERGRQGGKEEKQEGGKVMCECVSPQSG